MRWNCTTRRDALVALTSFVALPARAADRSLTFAAFRNGEHIGEQTMRFERQERILAVHTTAEFQVRLGPIPIYRYRHEAIERWVDDAFAKIATRTDQNGRVSKVAAERDGGVVLVTPASGPPFTAAPSTLPFTHWNRRIASAPLLNPQDGRLLNERALEPTSALVTLANGRRARASRIVFRGDAYIEDYYAADDVWTGLVGRLADGSLMEYRLV